LWVGAEVQALPRTPVAGLPSRLDGGLHGR
jgi:hypothetical protein